MILPDFSYTAPGSVPEAIALLQQYQGKAKVMAGGTDLINFIKTKAIQPELVIDLKEIPGMDRISYDPDRGLKIGALVKLLDVEHSDLVRTHYPVLSEAVNLIASTQIRGKGTLAGNVCNASPSADSVPSLFVLGAELVVQGPSGTRKIAIDEFYKGFKKLALAPDEIVTEIHIPPMAENTYAAYQAHTVRKAMDLAIVGSAAALTIDAGGICTEAKIALGAVDVSCVRAPEAEEVLKGQKITPELAEKAGQEAMAHCHPITDVRASAEYRSDMIRVFTRRAVLKAQERYQEASHE